MIEPAPSVNAATGRPSAEETSSTDETSAADETGVIPPLDADTGPEDESSADADTGQALQLAGDGTGGEQPLVRATDLDYGSADRRLFAQLSFTIAAGSFALITGPAGSGKSTLLLALAGRMAGLSGDLRVAGHDALARPRQVRAITSVARVGGLIELEPRHRVVDAVRDRAGTDGLPRRRAQRTFDSACTALNVAFGPKQLIGDLDVLHRGLLAAVLATLRPTQLLVFDDLQHGLRVDDQDLLAAALLQLTEGGITVVASSIEPTIVGDQIVRIPLSTAHGR